MRYWLSFILSALLFLAACESYDCTLYNYVGMYGTFYRDGSAVQLNDTLTISSGKAGPVLLNRAVGTSKINIPLTYWNEEDTLVFSIKGNDYFLQDSVWITKSNLVHYESPDCPTTLFHTIQSVRSTHVFIKEITITRSSVNYDQTENLQIHVL